MTKQIECDFIILAGNTSQIVHGHPALKSKLKELLQSYSQVDIMCYKLGDRVLIRDIF